MGLLIINGWFALRHDATFEENVVVYTGIEPITYWNIYSVSERTNLLIYNYKIVHFIIVLDVLDFI